jgi:dihydrolipoamide dehydrogenase
MMDRVVPVEDADVSAFLEKALTKQGMKIMTGAASKAWRFPPMA